MQDGPEAIEDWITPDGVEGLVSIVIPTCNRAAFLAETIDSVFEQEYRPIEIIVVDDDSTDDTQATVTRLQSQTPSGIELLYLHQAKAGGPAARNRGARRSTGEFIVFMDDDDLFSRRFLLSHIEAFALQPAANLSFGRWKRFKFVDSEYAILDHKGHFPPHREFTLGSVPLGLGNPAAIVSTPSDASKRSWSVGATSHEIAGP